MEWFRGPLDADAVLIALGAAYLLGILTEAGRRRIAHRMAWKVYHAGVHMPWRKRR